LHYSPLPRYQSRANVSWAIINAELTAAISIHVLAPALETGDLLFQREIAIGAEDSVTTFTSV